MSESEEPVPELGPFHSVRGLAYDTTFPNMLRVRQTPDIRRIGDVAAATVQALAPLRHRLRPGMTVAVTAGSRGIRDLPAVLRAAVAWLRDAGAVPFIVPAMGSHGGATADGQRAVLANLGITEATMGAPVRATMDTVLLGQIPDGPPVHLDAFAAHADGILVVNRVKAHTDFRGPVESGLAKITAIGLGKHLGAAGIHAYGAGQLARWVPEVAMRVIATGKVLGGLGIIENAAHSVARLAFLEPEDIGTAGEAALLKESKSLATRLPFDDIDVLVVDELGKDKSGTGLDTNVIGRMRIFGSEEFDRPRIAVIAVLDVSDPSKGNALGMGLADFVTMRLIQKLDLRSVYVNAITSGIGGPPRAQIPIALPTDRDVIAASMLCCGRPVDPKRVRVVHVHSTLDILELSVSEALWPAVEQQPEMQVVASPARMAFSPDGALCVQ